MDLDPQWEFVTDGVMGGFSHGALSQETVMGRAATVLRGEVSLENDGGFIQMAFDLEPDGGVFDASAWQGLELDVLGDGQRYDLRLRTDQLSRPWQSFRTGFAARPDWTHHRLPFVELVAHKTKAVFDPSRLRRIGLLAIGAPGPVELAVARIGFFR
ncbi:CIA30 family protein [uncultured Roseobacter sp.]|uniref:CIA30 family protein n=1 Tax=uncultured Roseobacter sp. TaxID=114847 RepID=UPI0026203E7D|nr:CIA30 family protein [uncultured Roseobacter sp.]